MHRAMDVFYLEEFPLSVLEGLRDLEKYKSSEWLLKQAAISLSFGFCKMCLKCWNLLIGTKKNKCFYCTCFVILFLLEIFSTLLTLLCPICLFHMNNHIDKVVHVMFVETVSGWNVTSKNIFKKSTNFFFAPGRRFQHFKHILQNAKLYLLASFSSNHWLDLYLPKSLGP